MRTLLWYNLELRSERMKEKSSVFMTLGTAVGLTIAVIIFVIGFVNKETSSWSALWFIVFAFIGRVIGYGLDRIVDKNNQRKHG